MNYLDALSYLQSFTDYEQVLRPDDPTRFLLGRVEQLLDLLGHPQRQYGTLHVVGTKGKGSTAAMIAASLTAADWRTGMYSSPHLHSFRERIRIDWQMIRSEVLGELVAMLQPLVDREHLEHPELGRLTTFEVTTAVALKYFALEAVQLAVIEAGLGGRLDATNVTEPLVTVISPIGLDHTRYLGNTVEAIAREKAAVIKPGGVVVSAAQVPSAQVVIEEVAATQGARLMCVGREINWHVVAPGQIGVSVAGRPNVPIEVPLLGRHQLENAALAVAALDALRAQGVIVPADAIQRGIASVHWPGRMEVLGKEPLLLVDGAHNPDSMRRLREALRETFGDKKIILVIGSSSDKDLAGIVEEIVPVANRIIVTQSRHTRAASVGVLAALASAICGRVSTSDNVAEALREALGLAGSRDLVCVTGSLFVAAEAREAILGGMVEKDPV